MGVVKVEGGSRFYGRRLKDGLPLSKQRPATSNNPQLKPA